ncbi:hypothetical protein diail_3254 [Diaporthe ilicicola]|nr:hypothetical protein diail_3254 [Diaporthe ilicicola]
MGRGAAWPPNSFGEWMVGQNFKSTPRRASGQTQILSVSLSEDEASGDETLQITYPGRRRGISATKQPTPKSSSSRKKVSFDSGRKPLKSALKKRGVSSSESSDTLVEDTSEDVGTTEKDESSAIDESDTSGDEVWVKKKKKPKPEQKSKANHVCKKETDSEDSSAVKDALPHETCDCKDCVKGRKILKAMIKLDAKQAAEGGSKKACDEKQKHKQKGTKKNAEATSTEASETTETEATEDDKEQPSKNQKKKGQSKNNEKKPSPKENKKPSPKTAEPKQSVDKSAFKLPIYPTSMQPNLLMPIKSKVVQCEHAIEGPNDPRPNAFINSGKGIVRVYHGPVWGNHTGELYGAANPSKLSPLPPSARPYPEYPHNWAGPPHYEHFPPFPPYPPYHQRGPSPRSHPAGPPPGTPVGQNVKADQPPTGPATDGLGLSGVRWPGTPPMLRDEKAREKTKQQSEATNNVGPSQPTQDPWSRKEARNGNTDAWASGGGNQAWGNDGNAKGSGNAWGEALGGDGNTQKADFSFLKHDQPKFERSKNKSAKGSQDGGWGGGGGGNWNQQGGNQAGDAAWGEQSGNTGWNDNGNSGWNDNNGNAANENQNWGAGSNHGSQRNANNDQGWNQRGSNRNSPQGGPSWNQQGPSFNILSGDVLGVGLQGPGQSLITPGPIATPVLHGIILDGVWATTISTATTMLYQATCQALGTILEALNPESIAVPISLLKAGANKAMVTPSLPVIKMVLDGMGLLHLKDHNFQVMVAVKAGEEEAIKAGVRRVTGTREVLAQEEDGTMTHPTTLDRLATRGRRMLLGTPKARQRIGSGITGVDFGILTIIDMVTGDPDRGYDINLEKHRRCGGSVGLLFLYCFSFFSAEFLHLHKSGWIMRVPGQGNIANGE